MNVKKQMAVLTILLALLYCGCAGGGSPVLEGAADHRVASLSMLESIPDSDIVKAKSRLVIAYGHTSHGSQIVDGLGSLDAFMTGRGKAAGLYSGLDLRTDMGNYDSTYGAYDLNNPSYTAWEAATRNYLSTHTGINVVIWSWCGGADTSEENINTYLNLMNALENDYPDIVFIYMTGHLNGTGLEGNLHQRNEQIRLYCRENGKVLFDFADIESYDPDGNYYADRLATDACNYDADGDGTAEQTGDPATPLDGDRNWAIDWQGSHAVNVFWYNCGAAHSQPLNANMKAYAFWWLMVRVADMVD